MPIIGLKTSHSSLRSSGYDQQYDQIPFEMVDEHQSIRSRNVHSPTDPKTFLYTDASHFGWGAHLEPMSLSFRGSWSEDQSQLHINMLEIMAIRFALINKRQKDCLWKHRTHYRSENGSLGFIETLHKQ